jgi:hypothetical protein
VRIKSPVNEYQPFQRDVPFVAVTFAMVRWDEELGHPVEHYVFGYTKGPFGVSPTAEGHWVVTHLPTGKRIALFEALFSWPWIRDVFVPQLALLFSPGGELLDSQALRQLVEHHQHRGPRE